MIAIVLLVAAILLPVGVAATVARQQVSAIACWSLSAGLIVLAAGFQTGAGPTAALAAESVGLLLPAAAALAVSPAGQVGWLALGASVVAGPVRAVTYDPFLDVSCTSACSTNSLAVVHLGAGLHDWLAVPAYGVPLLLLLHAVLARRPAIAVLAAASALTAFTGSALLPGAITGMTLVLLIGGSATGILNARAQVRDLSEALASNTDAQQTLRQTLTLPQLRVTYTMPGEPEGAGVGVMLGHGVQAWVDPGETSLSPALLEEAMRGSARLALENGALRVEVEARSREVEESRRRVVARTEMERHRLERDLHDSAQQLVLALGLELRARLATAPDAERQVLREGVETTKRVLEELRALAHDLHPSGLGPHDLDEVLAAAAQGNPGQLRVSTDVSRPLPPRVEYAVGLLVRGLVSTSPVLVTVTDTHDTIQVEVVGAAVVPEEVEDVFAVLGGSIDRGSHSWSGTLPVHPEVAT